MTTPANAFTEFTRRRRALERALSGLDRRLTNRHPTAADAVEVHRALRRVVAAGHEFERAARQLDYGLRGWTDLMPWEPLVRYK
jgi:hypothetical protein